MILQFGIEFKEAYELLVSAWAGAFAKQPGMLGLSRDWFNWCTTKLSAQNLTLLEEIRRMEQAIPVALALNSPNPTAVGFIKWVNSLSGSDAYEIIYSFDPNAQRKTPRYCGSFAKPWEGAWGCGTTSISTASPRKSPLPWKPALHKPMPCWKALMSGPKT